jgi:uncharacterized membrane protein SpoIIM required for sporulation
MDLDVFVAAHRAEWDRLEQLLNTARRPRRLTGHQVDELVELYQRTATHLSVLQGSGRDPVLLGRLSGLVARARNVVGGTRQAAWRDVARFLRSDFPAILYRTRWWWIGVTACCVLIASGWAAFLVTHPELHGSIATPEEVKQLVEQDFENYYSSSPAQDFAAQVWTNNALIAAGAIVSGLLLGIPVLYILYTNSVSVGIAAGLMISNDRGELFFGLILPHGLLELTSVFVAGALGLKLGWTVVDPGPRTRSAALAEEGRALVSGAIGLALLLFISGIIEAFVTPSGLPTWARVGIGVTAEVLFLLYVFVLGRRAHQQGVTGDIELREASVPTAA